MKLINFGIGDTLVMKKKHPCGSLNLKVLSGGSDLKLVCLGCGREMLISREKIEKSVKSIIKNNG